MKAPRLSVTVLNYNYERYLPRCLESILTQTYRDFEVILIDDCSPRSPGEAIKPYLTDPRVRFVAHSSNRGFQSSLIEGTEVHSRGDILTVISADDFILEKNAFSSQIQQLDDNENVALSIAGGALTYDDGRRVGLHPYRATTILSPQETFALFLFDPDFWAIHSGAMIPRTIYERVGGYRRDITMPLDLALFLKVCLEGKTAYCNDELYAYGVHGGQMTGSRFRKNAVEVSRIVADAARDGKTRFGLNPLSTHIRGVRRQLEPILQNEAYSGNRGATITAMASWLSVAPLSTLSSRSLWLATLYLVLGNHWFHKLQAFGRRIRRRPDLGDRA